MQRENHPSQAEPLSVQQLRHFQGTVRLGSNRSPRMHQKMMLIKETLNSALCAAAKGGCPSHRWDAAPEPGTASPSLKSFWDTAIGAPKMAKD